MKIYGHFIDGSYVDPIGEQWIDSHNPYTGEVWARIPKGCARDVDRAVAAAARAMREGPWARLTASARGPPRNSPIPSPLPRGACRRTRWRG